MKEFFKLLFTNKIILSFIILILIIVSTIMLIKSPSDKTCIVLFDVAGGSVIESQSIECGKTINKPKNPIKKGFDFKGWYLEDKEYKFDKPVKKNITLKAIWQNNNTTKVFKVTFDSDGGSNVEAIEIAEGEILSEPIPPTRNGYTFKGWYFNDNLFNFSFVILQDITLKAHWEKGKNKQDLTTQSNSHKPVANNLQSNSLNKNIEELLGTWYYEQDSSIYLKAYYGYNNGNQCLYFEWSNMDIYKGELYPINGYNSNYIIPYPVDESLFDDFLKRAHITIENSSIKVGKHKFVRTKKEIDLKPFDKYIGKWYLVGAENNNTYIEIKKETTNGTVYRIKLDGIDYPGEGISQRDINEGTHIFNKYKISYNNGYLIQNGKTYSKEKNKEVIHLDDFSISFGMNTSNSVYLGKTKQYTMEPMPRNATTLDGVWSSKDPTIAKVDSNGLITGLKIGSTQICFKSNDLNKTKCEYIYVKHIKVTKIIPTQNTIEVNVGERKTLNYNIEPKDATSTKMYLDTDNYDVASVGETSITGRSPGTTTITISYSEDRTIKAEIKVIVKEVPVSNITLDKESLDLVRGKSFDLTATISPSNATNKNIIWTSSNELVAKVSNNGKITATGQGTTTITAKTEDGGYTDSVQVNVTNPPLEAYASVGIVPTCNNSICVTYTNVEVRASGGSGIYTYSVTIKRDGVLIGTSDNHFINLPYSSGAYEVEFTVTDSLGKTTSGKEYTIISIN